MEKAHKHRYFLFLHVICIFALLLSPFQVAAAVCADCGSTTGCGTLQEDDEITNYEELG